MKKVIVIVGPTAVGKTALSIALAKKFPVEIISGDSMQVYQGMDIGTGKIKPEETDGIRHHMLDIKRPDEPFTVADYKNMVQSYIEKISQNAKYPVIVGGSGLYIQAVLYDYSFTKQGKDEAVTNRLEEELNLKGIEPLYERLTQVDPEQAEKIHPNNHRRVIRALEIYETTGKTMSEWHRQQSEKPVYNYFIIGLEMERQQLYEKINARVDHMIAEGLVEEVNKLYQNGYEQTQAMQAIGYKELLPYIKGECDLRVSIELLKQNSRRYAKRQYTWFKNKMNVHWFLLQNDNKDDVYNQIFSSVEQFLANH